MKARARLVRMQPMLTGFETPAVPADVHRLFFALWPDDAVRQRMAGAAAMLRSQYAPRGRWLGAHRYHLTLRFLGEFDRVPPTLADAALAAADTLRLAAFDLPLDRAGSFRGSRVWWLGCEQVPDGLQQLWRDLGLALGKAGVRMKDSHSLTPHVTLLRDAAESLPDTAIEPIAWPVREFVLIHSQLGNRNAYDILRRWPLDQ